MSHQRTFLGTAELPRVSQRLLTLFRWYARRYIRRHFDAVRLSRGGPLPTLSDAPLVIYLNHPSWWDPMIALLVGTERLGDRPQYAPIDQAMLRRYRFFGRLGFFGLEARSSRGARTLLTMADAIFSEPGSVLWITPQGRFTDPRVRALRFLGGLAAVVERMHRGLILPMALEYPFWNERQPEALIRFGEPLSAESVAGLGRDNINVMLEERLIKAQDALAEEAIRRDRQAFEDLLSGKAGVGFVYDSWRWLKACVRGQSFDRHHSTE